MQLLSTVSAGGIGGPCSIVQHWIEEAVRALSTLRGRHNQHHHPVKLEGPSDLLFHCPHDNKVLINLQSSLENPTPPPFSSPSQFRQLGPFFPDVKNNVLCV